MLDRPEIWVLLGFLVGSVGTLIGAGGGFILVPVLLLAKPEFSPATVTAISMAIVAANAVSGTIAYSRSGRIDYRAGMLFALFTIPGSILGVRSAAYISPAGFHWLFGLLMLATAVFLFLSQNATRPSGAPSSPVPAAGVGVHRLTDREGNEYVYPFYRNPGIAISLVVGYLSPLLGIGGGIIHVPALVNWLKFPVYVATATSHFILAVMATVSVITHYVNGNYADPLVWHLVLWLGLGAAAGAQLGAWLSHRLKSGIILQALAVSLGLAGLRILIGKTA